MAYNKSTLSGSISVYGDIELTGSLLGTASWAIKALTSSFFDGDSISVASLTVTNTASIQYLDVVYQSSSVIYSSGSNIFGDSPSDVQTLHGQVNIINSASISGSLTVAEGITGSLQGTASYSDNSFSSSYSVSSSESEHSQTASYVETAQTASYFFTSSVTSASFAESASYTVSASRSEYSAFADDAATALLANTASYVENAQSASYFITSSVTSASFAQTASYALSVNSVAFSKEIHVSSGSGNDTTGDGSLSKPYATLTKALTILGSTGEALIVHPGTYRESVTVTQLNTSIQAASVIAGGIVLVSGSITVASSGAASSVRISGLAINNLLHTNSSSLYVKDCDIKNSVVKSGNATYNEYINTMIQAAGGIAITGPGTVVFQGDKQALLTVNNAAAVVVVKDSLGLTGVTVTAGTFAGINSSIYSLASGSAAITSAAGSIVQLYSSNIATPAGLPERVAIGGFFGYDDITFNKVSSTLGTSLGVKAHFQNLDALALTATGSLFGTASWSQNALAANTASWANNFLTSSVTSASLAQTASYFFTSSVTNATYAQSASYFSGSNIEVSNLLVKGTASIEYLDVRFESASVIYSSGSNIFGDAQDDTQTLNGQVNIINSALISGSLVVLQGITGSLLGTASYADNSMSASYALSSSVAVSASYALSASYAETASYVENAQTASYFFTSSVSSASIADFANSASSASVAQTASYVNFVNLPSYTNDTDAIAGGLIPGDLYRNGNFVQIVISL